MQLRTYQFAAIENLRAKLRAGAKRLVLVAPTGAGKTVIASEMIRLAVTLNRRVIFVAHRKELIDQSHDKLKMFGVESGVIMANDARRDDYHKVQVCSIQTLFARRKKTLPPGNLIIVDECHHSASNTYREVLDCYPDATVIGLTATPWRTDKIGLRDMYEGHVLAATPAELIKMGALTDYDAFAYDAPDLHEVKSLGGDFNQKDLGLACNTAVLVGSVVSEYQRYATGRSAILFPVDIAHSLALCAEFKRAGVTAEHVDCNTPKLERERVLGGFQAGKITVVSSVGVLTEGFDAPRAEVCILARPTKSLALHIQMIGRVLRPSPATGKTRALIHDHAGNVMRHGFPDDERDYSLTTTPKRERMLRTCPFCRVMCGSFRPDGTCPKCGELIAEAKKPSEAALKTREAKEYVEGTRITIDRVRALRAEREAHGYKRQFTDEEIAKTHRATREEKIGEYKRLAGIRDAKSLNKGFVGHAFRETFGHWPKFDDAELATTPVATKPFLAWRK